MPTDAELLRAWSEGDRIAGNELVSRHFPALFRFFRSKVDTGVEDLAHETLLACLEHPERFGGASFRAYLLGIARHRLFHHFRKKQREAKAMRLQDRSVMVLSGTPSRIMAARDEIELLWAALREIPIDFQITLELFYWELLPIDEIAVVLDVRAGTVKSRLARARDALRQRLASADGALLSAARGVSRRGWENLLRDLGDAPGLRA